MKFIYSGPRDNNPFDRISEVAARLGVEAESDAEQPGATILAVGADGKKYDVWKVVSAFLDKLDEATK